jgi:S1-C subfamily serine protease
MRAFLLLLVFVMGCGGWTGCLPPPPPPQHQGEIIDTLHHALHATVALTVNSRAYCTGVVVDVNLKGEVSIITASHCVEGFAAVVMVKFYGEEGENPFVVTRFDKSRDLALLQGSPLVAPTAVSLATRRLPLGEDVYLIGHPSGNEYNVTRGIVSKYYDGYGPMPAHLVQTDAACSGGCSGGGMYNTRGELYGINIFVLVHRYMIATVAVSYEEIHKFLL